jgi:predicted phosphoribosyltransferase
MFQQFTDRYEAGRLLGEKLHDLADRNDLTILALPRGGVPVAFEVANRLNAPMDVFVVRKLGVPGHEELAMGAIAPGGIMVLNEDLVNYLGIPRNIVDSVAAMERKELERRDRLYRGVRLPPEIENRTIVLVDDGLATGSTMRAAISAVRRQNPKSIIVAVPVAPHSTQAELQKEADSVVSVLQPEPFDGVGRWYSDFSQTSDDEVRRLIELNANRERQSHGQQRSA